MKIILFFVLYRQHSHMFFDAENDVSEEETRIMNAENQHKMNSAVNQYLEKLQKM